MLMIFFGTNNNIKQSRYFRYLWSYYNSADTNIVDVAAPFLLLLLQLLLQEAVRVVMLLLECK